MKNASNKLAPTNQNNLRATLPQEKGKTKTLMAQLLDAVRGAVDPFRALQDIDARFDHDERDGINKLVRFAKRHAQTIIDGSTAEGDAVRRTIRLAENVGNLLDTRFEAIMRDSFVIFDGAMSTVRATAPEILVRDSNKIIALQEALRRELSADVSTYDDMVEAYKAMMAYIPSVSAEAEETARRERDRLRREREKGFAKEILDELNDLEEF